MEPFLEHIGLCVPLDRVNIDTDQIIPARFLKATDREGFGENLFRDWRFKADGTPLPDFVLNQEKLDHLQATYLDYQLIYQKVVH